MGIKQQNHTHTHTDIKCTAKNPPVICSRQKKKKDKSICASLPTGQPFRGTPCVYRKKTTLKDLHVLLHLHQVRCNCFKQGQRSILLFPLRCRVCTCQSAAPTIRVDLCRHNTQNCIGRYFLNATDFVF